MLERVLLSMMLAAAAGPSGSKPAPEKPAEASSTQPAAAYEMLDNGRVQFVAPEGWTKADRSSTPTRAVYVSDTREGMMSIEVPPDMKIGDGTAAAVVKRLRAMRNKSKSTIMEAKEEPDNRFDVRVHEQYKQGERTADQLHLYKQVGSRAVMVTVNSVSDDEATTKAIHELGEATMVSVKLAKPQKSTPARRTTTAKPKPR
jgi:hypothetical protein